MKINNKMHSYSYLCYPLFNCFNNFVDNICEKEAEIYYYYIRHNLKKILYIFHIICFLLLWSKSATSFRSMCLPALCASFKQWRISRYWVFVCPTWISFWIPGFTSFLVKKNCYVFTSISLHAEMLSSQRPRKYP